MRLDETQKFLFRSFIVKKRDSGPLDPVSSVLRWKGHVLKLLISITRSSEAAGKSQICLRSLGWPHQKANYLDFTICLLDGRGKLRKSESGSAPTRMTISS